MWWTAKFACGAIRRLPFLVAKDAATAAIAAGVVQHHHDDGWFHRTQAFTELSLKFTVAVRDILGGDGSFRSHFLGHILVEILLDSELIEKTIHASCNSITMPLRCVDYLETSRCGDVHVGPPCDWNCVAASEIH